MRIARYRKIVAAVIAILVCVGLWRYSFVVRSSAAAIRAAYSRGDYQAVRLLARSLKLPDDSDSDAWWYSGMACKALGENAEAFTYFRTAADVAGDSPIASDAVLQISAIHEERGQYSQAINFVAELADQQPANAELRREAARLLNLAGRRYEANQHHLALVRSSSNSVDDLIFLANRHEPFAAPPIENAMRDPGSSEFRVTRAMILWRSGKLAEAAKLLREQIAAAKDSSLEARALIGRVLLGQGRMEMLAQWNADLPPSSDEHPDVWYVRGVWAEYLKRQTVAMQCFRHAVRLDDSFAEAIFRLSAVGVNSLSDDVKSQMSARISSIEQYQDVCKSIFFKGPERQLVLQAVDLAESLQRFHEAAGWCRILITGMGSTESGRERLRQLESQIAAGPDRAGAPRWNLLADSIDPNSRIPAWPTPQSVDNGTKGKVLAAQFVMDAASRNLVFEYENGAEAQSGLMIQQSMGGGVAVLDYDRDAWPDVFFSQGKSHGGSVSDGLFRNLSGKSFARVDQSASCGCDDYSHGAAVGDVNDDGFPDLYVANVGPNRLFINNGDGTFTPSSEQFGAERWTVSCAIADLNGDSFPDLFDVNYLEWGRPFTEVCTDSELSLPRTCPPDRFKGELNDLLLNSVDGEFSRATEEAGIGELFGKGLNVVAADFDGSRRLSLFIANDEVPNSFLQRETEGPTRPDEMPRFINRADAAGLAFDGTGQALACMGVATSDVNHDGLLDMFVTNFYRQPNTLYLSISTGVFQDATRSSGLAESGLLKLGFGTQFLDANLDGEPDLIVVNGHLDDFSRKGIPFAMQPQLHLNHGSAQFAESATEEAGPYFEEKHIARGIAKLDWNRDGLTDVAVSHIGKPVELLTNDTPRRGHYVTIQLIGVDSGRDAVGTTVTLTTNRETRWQQVTAGDGYASSNEKTLTFGLDDETVAESVTIVWPSGRIQEFRNIESEHHYIALESAPRMFKVSP